MADLGFGFESTVKMEWEKLPDWLKADMMDRLKTVTTKIRDSAKSKARKDPNSRYAKGKVAGWPAVHIADAIKSRTNAKKMFSMVYTYSLRGVFLEKGHKATPYELRKKREKKLQLWKDGKLIDKKTGKRKRKPKGYTVYNVPAHPYLEPAFKEHRDELMNVFKGIM